jgi:hypothetical protein
MSDPFWHRFCTPLAQRIAALVAANAGASSPTADGGQYILEEKVDAVLANGKYQIGADALGTKGKAALRVGQRVHVLWRGASRVVILTHQWQRAQGATWQPVGGGMVEELFIAGPSGSREVWFRNASLVANLNLRALLGADPTEVKWGTNPHAFYVRVGASVYHTFVFERGDPGAPLRVPPTPTLLRTERPWDGGITLATMTWAISN